MATMVMIVALAASANAMSYRQASRQALFLTDKMAYELNMTDDQYNAVYEVNLDYFMSLTNGIDIFGMYWSTRNSDLMYILNSYQYSLYIADNYFYRPVYLINNTWSFGIYSRYMDRRQFFRTRPASFGKYRGGHKTNYYTSRRYSRPNIPKNPNVVSVGPSRPAPKPQQRPGSTHTGNTGFGNKPVSTVRPIGRKPATKPSTGGYVKPDVGKVTPPKTNFGISTPRPSNKPVTKPAPKPNPATKPSTGFGNRQPAPKPTTTGKPAPKPQVSRPTTTVNRTTSAPKAQPKPAAKPNTTIKAGGARR